MKKTRLVPLALVLLVALGAWLALACDSDDDAPDDGDGPAVVLERIEPSSGPFETEVTLHGTGFTAENNDIGFRNDGIDYQGQHVAYQNGVPSADGTSMRITVFEVLGACAQTQLGENEACPDIGIILPPGETEIFVINANGESNGVTFTVTGGSQNQP